MLLKDGRGIASVVSAPTPLLASPALAASAGGTAGPQLDSLIKEVAMGFHSTDPQALDRCRAAVGKLRRCCLPNSMAFCVQSCCCPQLRAHANKSEGQPCVH